MAAARYRTTASGAGFRQGACGFGQADRDPALAIAPAPRNRQGSR
jgi:hypothetical protein